MSETGKAVFLSYASEDAGAALKICESLRAAGVEVWFDQSELVGGDAWDQKIRRHIKECALLIPVISAATQARTEGYFRLEWRLADQRTHLMAKGRPFLLPVVIDDTRDAEAHVPDSFTEVQWTRLKGGETSAAFVARVKKLLSGEEGARASRPVMSEPTDREVRSPASKSKPVWLWVLLALVVALPAYCIFKPRRSPEEIARMIQQAQSVANQAPNPATAAAVTVSQARKLVNQARALIDDDPLAVRENFLTAKRLGERAIELDPGDAEGYAVAARASFGLIANYRDSSPASLAAARSRAESAIRLAPQSVEAALALAEVDLLTGSRPAEVMQRLEALLQRAPEDRRIFQLLQVAAAGQGHYDEAEKWIRRAIALPGGDPESLNNRASIFWALNQYPQMAATIEQSLAQRTTASACHHKLMLLVWGWGDLPAGRAWVEQMPAPLLQEDRVAMLAYLTWYWSRQPERALEVLQRFPRPFIEQGALVRSTDYLAGNAQLLAGHAEAAKIAFAAGLKAANERLAAEPNNREFLFEKTRLSLRLGQRAEAEQSLRVLRELVGPDAALLQIAEILVLSGANDEAIAAATRTIDRSRSRWPVAVNHLRNDPVFDPLRADPRFRAIIAKGEAQLAELRAGGTPAGVAPAAAPPPEADAKSVAVLAFANLSDDKGNEYFSDGISEELLTVLQKIPGLHVAARTSSFYFKGKEATAQEIGTKLGVANLVEGSVQKAGSRVKVTARLSRAATGEELWSRSYTRELKDVFALQEELALAIVGELRGQLGGGVNAAAVKAAVQGGTTNPEAYQWYLQGRFHAARDSEKNMGEALAAFQRAVELDPDFALAWAGLGLVHMWSSGFSAEVGQAGFMAHLANARKGADRALTLAPKLPEALLVRALIQLNFDFDWKGAGETLRTALAVAPADSTLLTAAGNLAGAVDDQRRAIELYRQAVALDPVNPLARSFLAYELVMAGKYPEAQEEYARVVELNPAAPWAHAGLGLAFILQGKFEEAVNAGQDDAAEWARLLIKALAHFGQKRRPEADAALAQLTAKFGDTAAYQIAEVHAYRAERDEAFSWLERAFKQRDSGLVGLRHDPLMASLKHDPRWLVFLRKLNLAPDE